MRNIPSARAVNTMSRAGIDRVTSAKLLHTDITISVVASSTPVTLSTSLSLTLPLPNANVLSVVLQLYPVEMKVPPVSTVEHQGGLAAQVKPLFLLMG